MRQKRSNRWRLTYHHPIDTPPEQAAMTIRIAIIGAGISGIASARQLADIAEVSLFEKSRGLGGRMSTRRTETYSFDHAAQFFTARSPEFQHTLDTLGESVAQPWTAKVLTLEANKKPYKRLWFEPHYVGLPGMNALTKALAANLNIFRGTRICRIEAVRNCWRLWNEKQQALGDFDWVICSAPAPQTRELLPDSFCGHQALDAARYSPCLTLMLGFEQHLPSNFDAALVRNEPVAWVSLNNSKPGRPPSTSLVVQSDNHWAEENLDRNDSEITNSLLSSLHRVTGVRGEQASYMALHRWLYARVEAALETDFLIDKVQKLAACGDWCLGNRVEDAYLSGDRLGRQLRNEIQ